ncbi:MAG TPA: YkgJ family cysteine cluster protein [Methanoregulaceae archaeon]|nr:YkgJ family cysteine cluster protein [Methanoregulaceae archaeon]HRY75751.1 YkgJ family cysteine cluster protein [Methanoregulaceae archaeon]
MKRDDAGSSKKGIPKAGSGEPDRIVPGISARLAALRQDLFSVTDFPDGKLAEIIRDVGFACDRCTKCCTKEFNDHVFLLDRDTAVIRAKDPAALIPAPYFELCDQHGRFYDSGYALRTMTDGTCFFLEEDRCRIYNDRLSICRIYPYMLHREPDERGIVDWRQISGLNRHGTYHNEIQIEESVAIAREVKSYEIAFLEQTIRFYEFICDHFTEHGLRHIRKVYDDRMRAFRKGEAVEVFVLYDGELEPWRMRGDAVEPVVPVTDRSSDRRDRSKNSGLPITP